MLTTAQAQPHRQQTMAGSECPHFSRASHSLHSLAVALHSILSCALNILAIRTRCSLLSPCHWPRDHGALGEVVSACQQK